MTISILLWLLLAGIAGGFIAGLIGIGGGIIYVFILPEALLQMGCPTEYLPQAIITNSLAAIFFASMSANIQLWKHKNFYLRPVLLVGLSAVVTSWLTYHFIVISPWYNIRIFNLISIVLMLYMLWLTLTSAKKQEGVDHTSINARQYLFAGVCGGIIAALSGLGGGIVIIPILNVILNLGIRKASSISSGAICISSLTMSLLAMSTGPDLGVEWSVGYIMLPLVLLLAVGVIWASPFGVRTAQKISSTQISYIYAFILGVVIIKKVAELWYIA